MKQYKRMSVNITIYRLIKLETEDSYWSPENKCDRSEEEIAETS